MIGPYAGRHCIETDCLWLCLGQGEIGQGASEAAVAVVEGMQGDEPEMGNAGTEQRIERRIIPAGLEPAQKILKQILQPFTRRCFEMHRGAVDPALHDLHRLAATQCTDPDTAGQ